MDSHPNVKYVYVGKIYQLLPYFMFKLFQYYLHFQLCTSKWACLRTEGLIKYGISQNIIKKYYADKLKKLEKKVNSMDVYDYYAIHNMRLNKSNIGRFNKRLIKHL